MRELIHASAISKPKANINIFNGVRMKFTYKESSLLILIAMVVKICVSETKVLSCVFWLWVGINLKRSLSFLLHLIKTFLFSTCFMALVFFYTPWKHQETFSFLMFSGGIERPTALLGLIVNIYNMFTATGAWNALRYRP